MARGFANGSSQYLYRDAAVTNSYPFALMAWFNCTDESVYPAIMWLGDKDTANAKDSTLQLWNNGKLI